MTEKSLIEITEDVFTDVLAIFGLPGASASGLFGGFLRSKVDDSLKILLAELRAGEVLEAPVWLGRIRRLRKTSFWFQTQRIRPNSESGPSPAMYWFSWITN